MGIDGALRCRASRTRGPPIHVHVLPVCREWAWLDDSVVQTAAKYMVSNEGPSDSPNNLITVALPSLPAIVGTGFFLTGVLVSKIAPFESAHRDLFQELTAIERVKIGLGYALFLTCYFGAGVGPLLLPLAGWQALAFT